jgi:hypothetical protein
MTDKNFSKLHTELSQVLRYIKYSSDKKKLKEIVNKDDVYKNISRRTANMINIVTGSKLVIDNGKEKVDMCKAIQEMREDARLEGRNEGRSEGARDANTETAKKVIALGKLSFDEIAVICNLTPEEVQKLAEEM